VDPTALGKRLEEARAAARRAVRDAEAIVERLGDGSGLSKKQAQKRIVQLQNALVEVMKHRAVTVADERRLTQLALAEPLDAQRAIVAEVSAAVARLHDVVATVTWNLHVQEAQGPAGALVRARDVLARMRARVAKVEALSADVLARRQAALIARLDREMQEVKMGVAVTIADEKRFAAAAGDNRRDDFWALRLRPPDPEAAPRVLAAQKSAVEDLKKQLVDVNGRVEVVKRRARIEAATRGLLK
jgi:phage I-like protein